MAITQSDWLSVNETAVRLSLTDGRIRQLLRGGELQGVKINDKAWMIPTKEIAKYEKRRDSSKK